MIVVESARAFKRFVSQTSLNDFARQMVIRMGLAFMLHRGRMPCSSAAGVIASESIHRGQLTRFLARPRWQKVDFNGPLRAAMLSMESLFGFSHQVSAINGKVCRLSAYLPLPTGAETETSRVLRASGEAGSPQRGPRAACFFDDEK